MIHITMKSKGAVNRSTLLSINKPSGQIVQAQTAQAALMPAAQTHTSQAQSSQASSRTHAAQAQTNPASSRTHAAQVQTASACPTRQKPLPPLLNPVQKGQKVSLSAASSLRQIRACFGWTPLNPQCDVDVSAFLLGTDGHVLGDTWFVFYGQGKSPDQSVVFHTDSGTDREYITIDLQKLNPAVQKIVFVLTIHEALQRRLHFGMLKDAYIRILSGDNASELVSFKMTDYYTNVISMMIGEIYRHKGTWKFNAIGNGVAKDLAGLCALYGVEVSD